MGDMTAKVGRDNTKYERTMEREGCGIINENGERLVEFCTNYDLVIGGTLFPHSDIHKMTRYSSNERKIGHFMINGTWQRLLIDVRVKRGADVGNDHHMVVVTLTWRNCNTPKSEVTLFSDEISFKTW